jgi:glyoxylase-like metal-dependent hydrolase (beta-lactamase superfamily II)
MFTLLRPLAATLMAMAAVAAMAQTDKNTLIDAVAAAYGGDAFTNIKNYEITERYIAPATGQSWSPELVNIGGVRQHLVHELSSGNVYFENWFVGRGGGFPNVIIVKADQGWTVDPVNNRYGEAASADPYVIAGGTLRTTDTLLARELVNAREAAEHVGSAMHLNRAHDLLKIPFPQSADLTLYIDKQTHLINRMRRDNAQLGALDYVFSDHVKKDGITRATRTSFLVAGQPNMIGANREVAFNVALPASRFEVPANMKEEGKRLDDSEMVVNRLSKNVYHIGQSGAYSLFVDTGSEIIAAGGYAGLADRFARFQSETGVHRPLRYQVITHHHTDHLGGIGDALDLGAQLVTVRANVEPIRAASRRDVESGRFLNTPARMTFGSGDGRVELYDVSTIHAASNLLFYVPSTRTLFMADHLSSPYEKGVPSANLNTVSMAAALQPLDLNYSKIATAHGARIYSRKDLENSVAAFSDQECPQGWALCDS